MAKIIGIRLFSRNKNANTFQNILSEFGCYIKTRIGLHHLNEGFCSNDGIILLEFTGNNEVLQKMKLRFNAIKDIKFSVMDV